MKKDDVKLPDAEYSFGVTDDHQEIELPVNRAVINLPKEAIFCKIDVTIYRDNKLIEVTNTLGTEDIREAFRKGDDYIDDDDRFVLTDKGKALFDEFGRA